MGLRVERVTPDGVGAVAGLLEGDIIIGCDWLPVDTAHRLSERLGREGEHVLAIDRSRSIRYTTVKAGKLGVALKPISGSTVVEVVTVAIAANSAAARAGLLPGDRVISIGGRKVTTLAMVQAALANTSTNPAQLQVRRGSEHLEIEVESGEGAAFHTGPPPGSDPRRLRVESVRPGSKAEAVGLRVADTILELNGEALNKPKRFAATLGSKTVNTLYIRRDDKLLVFELPQGPVGLSVNLGSTPAGEAGSSQAKSTISGLNRAQNLEAAKILRRAPELIAGQFILAIIAMFAKLVSPTPSTIQWSLALVSAALGIWLLISTNKALGSLPDTHFVRKSGRQVQWMAGLYALAMIGLAVEFFQGRDSFVMIVWLLFLLLFGTIQQLLSAVSKDLGGPFPAQLKRGGYFILGGLLIPVLLVIGPGLVLNLGPKMAKRLRTGPGADTAAVFD